MKRSTKSFISRLYHANDKNNHHTFFLNYFSLLLIVNLSENALSCLIPTLISLCLSVSSSLLLMLIKCRKSICYKVRGLVCYDKSNLMILNVRLYFIRDA